MPYYPLSFAKKKFIVNAAKFWTVVTALLILLASDIVWLIVKVKTLNISMLISAPLLVALVSTFLILGIIALFIWILFQINKRLDAKMNEYLTNYEKAYKGADGENQVYKVLIKLLDKEQYKIYPNVIIPGVKSDLDFVVVGPKGIMLIEVKNYNTHTVFTHDNTFSKIENGYIIKLWPDIREVIDWRAKKLERYLAEFELYNIKIRKILVFVNPNSVEIQGSWKNKYKVFVVRGILELEKFLLEGYVDKKVLPTSISKITNILDQQKTNY